MKTQTLTLERVLPHPPEKIWRALTEGSLLKHWLLANDFQPVIGHKFQFCTIPRPGWDGMIAGEVLTVEPHHRLAYRWETWAEKGAGPDLKTVVTWTLEAVRDGTLVRMEQSGFGTDQPRALGGARYGWNGFFERLQNVLVDLAESENERV